MYMKRVGKACNACSRTAKNSKAHSLIEIGKIQAVLCPKCREALKVALAMDALGGGRLTGEDNES